MKPKQLKTRILSMIMSALMLLGTMPDTGLTALAADDADPGADGQTSFIEEYLSGTGLLDPSTEYEDDNDSDPTKYNVWIGDVQITETNKDDVLGDGKVSYDPESKTLNLNNAILDKLSTKESGAPSTSANLCVGEDLTIKGSGSFTSSFNGIVGGGNFLKSASLTIDADLTMDVGNTGIAFALGNLTVDGGNIVINSGEGICFAGVYGNTFLKGGSLKLSGEIGLSGSLGAVIINGTAIDASGTTAAVALDYPKYSTLEIYSPSFIEEPAGAKTGLTKIGKSDALVITDADGNTAKNVKISVKSGVETKTVTFDLNGHGHGSMIPRVVGKGDKVCRPADPSDSELEFNGWYKEAACKNEYNFDTPVENDITLYAEWVEPTPLPDPVYSSGSTLDPVPEVIPGITTDLYLVKGQKFNVGKGWTVNKDSKKLISISKKGALNAKKEGEAVITAGSGSRACSITVHITAPKLETKTLKLEIGTADAKTSDQIILDYDRDTYKYVIWHSASPDVASVNDQGVVTAHSKGTAKVSAYINGKAYTCTVSVKEKETVQKRTIHIAKGASKSISIKGLKKPVWSATVDGIVTIKNNKKIIADNPGHTVLYTTVNDITYSIDVLVEDLTLTDDAGMLKPAKGKDKYDLSLSSGAGSNVITRIDLDDSVQQRVIFKSNKPDIAFVNEYGEVYVRSKGKCKFTAKVDGKTITINVKVD